MLECESEHTIDEEEPAILAEAIKLVQKMLLTCQQRGD